MTTVKPIRVEKWQADPKGVMRPAWTVEGPIPIVSGPGIDAPAEWVLIGDELVHVDTLPDLIEALIRMQAVASELSVPHSTL